MNKRILAEVANVFDKHGLSQSDAIMVYSKVINKISIEGGDKDVVGLVEGLEDSKGIGKDLPSTGGVGLPELKDEMGGIGEEDGFEEDVDKTDAVKDEIMELLEDLEDEEIEEILEEVSSLIDLAGEEEQQAAMQNQGGGNASVGMEGSTMSPTTSAPSSSPPITDTLNNPGSSGSAMSGFSSGSGMSDWGNLGVGQ